jgi:hypothetical protein
MDHFAVDELLRDDLERARFKYEIARAEFMHGM